MNWLQKSLCIWGSVLLLCLFRVSSAEALVVADPGAYARFAKNLEALHTNIAELKKQYGQLEKMNHNLTGTHQFASGLRAEITHLQQQLRTATKGFLSGDMTSIIGIQSELDTLFMPWGKRPYGKQLEAKQFNYIQRSLKGSIESAEHMLFQATDSYEEVSQLAEAIDEAQNIKTAMDIQNRLTLALLRGQQQMILLLAHLAKVQSVIHYSGIDSQQPLLPTTSPGAAVKKAFENGFGFDANNHMPCDPIFDKMLGCR